MFLRMINHSLVDSNMFLRSIFLSIDFFMHESESLSIFSSFLLLIYFFLSKPPCIKVIFNFLLFANQDFRCSDYTILTFFDDFDRRIRYLCRMINTINIHNISQENVSCLNTTLVVLMLANRKNQLAKYLKAIKIKSTEVISNDFGSTNNQTHDAVLNFRCVNCCVSANFVSNTKV